jgi:hypothetical protein
MFLSAGFVMVMGISFSKKTLTHSNASEYIGDGSTILVANIYK